MDQLVGITRLTKSELQEFVRELDIEKKKSVRVPQLPLEKLSKRVVDRLDIELEQPIPECRSCGLCCHYPAIVPVTQTETARLNEFVEVTLDGHSEVVIDAILPRDRQSGSCVNLSGRVGDEVGCRIYSERPSVCRDFEAGSPRCHEYRRMYDLEPQLLIQDFEKAVSELEALKPSERIEDVVIIGDGQVCRLERSEDGVRSMPTARLKMFAFLSADEMPHELHTYYAADETWYENELLGLTLEEAQAVIAAKNL